MDISAAARTDSQNIFVIDCSSTCDLTVDTLRNPLYRALLDKNKKVLGLTIPSDLDSMKLRGFVENKYLSVKSVWR
eukprot:IDg17139t1